MNGQQIIFIIISAVTLGSAVIVVTGRSLFHAALAMMLSFAGVAGLYVLLEAGFIAASQLIIYIGAISILIIFAIMMTRRIMSTTESPFNTQWLWGLGTAVVVFLGLSWTINGLWGSLGSLDTTPTVDPAVLEGSVVALGRLLVSPDAYVLPFELISLLLLAALVGSIAVARPEDEE